VLGLIDEFTAELVSERGRKQPRAQGKDCSHERPGMSRSRFSAVDAALFNRCA